MKSMRWFVLAVIAAFVWTGPSCAQTTIGGGISLSFGQAVARGLHYNLDLLADEYNIPMAQMDELTAGLINNPSLLYDTIFEPFGKDWDQTSAGGPRQFDAGISYSIDLSGKVRAAKKDAHKQTEITTAQHQDFVRQKLRDIRLAYIDVMTLQQELELSQETKNSLQELVDVINDRIGRGGNLPLLKLQAQVALDQQDLDFRQRTIGLRAAQTNLAIILGYRRGTVFQLTTKLRDFNMPDLPPLDGLVKYALDHRPDLKALRLTLEKAGLDKNLAIAQKWDDITVTAQASTQGPTKGDPDGASPGIPRGNSWDAGISIPLPLFNRNQGNIRKADYEARQSKEQVASLELSIPQEIEGDYDQLDLNRGLIQDYEKQQLANARKIRDEEQKLFGMGSNDILGYFNALNNYTTAVTAYYDAVGEYRRDVARLDAACAEEVLP